MRLTTFTDYGLRVLLYLGAQPGHRATIAEVARAFRISENHLVKVVHFLGKEGWLTNVRGRGGGVQLAVAPEAINVDDFVRRAEGPDALAECFEKGNHCRLTSACRLQGVLAEAAGAFHAALSRHTLADLLRDSPPIMKVLFPHRAA